ncbi:cell division cycle 7-related protein kinase-like isoform X2 [Prorops nasuta]|uniref:cell division cycle 7-related protein kinase-like isoform X2 n=1 Tax=Prorops nasuta TaxID=863751 RepID=UPI0034CE6610
MEMSADITEDSPNDCVTNLISTMPSLNELFHIYGKVGEGTFSSVFLGILKKSKSTKKFALKYLVPTSHPDRVKRELECLQKIGGTDHIVGLEMCLRYQGSIVFVMPYLRHNKFSDYVHDMSIQETKDYMRALLTALRRVHKFNVIHRDIKPTNFLYDRHNRRYLLVDFGLAQKVSKPNTINRPKQTELQPMSLKRKRLDENTKTSLNMGRKVEEKCFCFGKPKICSICLIRPTETAPRAGTPGFRAPEVLLKHNAQTSAIDIWASGVILLCILSGAISFFHGPDDCSALAEITSVFGTSKVQQYARQLGKKIIFSEEIPETDIMLLCQKLRRRKSSNIPDEESTNIEYPREAYSLLTRLLSINYKTRITAEEALNEPFLRQ